MRTRAVCLSVGAIVLCACSSPVGSGGDIRNITGTVRHFSIEGGFYAIRGDDSVTYDPTNLAASDQVDGLRVQARVAVQKDMGNTHMVGPIVNILQLTAVGR
jgi:hypothetical protein